MAFSRPNSNSSNEIIDVVNLNENDLIEMNAFRNNESIPDLENRLNSARFSGNFSDIMEINFKLGDAYADQTQYEMAYEKYNEAIQLQTHSHLSSWDNCHRRGIQLYHLKKYEEAGKIFFENLREVDAMFDNSDKIYYRAESIEKYGACLRELNKCDDAIIYLKQLYEIATNSNDSILEFIAVCQLEFCFKRIAENLKSQNSGLVTVEQNEALQNAKNYNMERLRMAKENDKKYVIPTEKVAEIYYFSGNYKESIKLYKIILEVSQIRRANRNDLKALKTQCNLGHAYFASGSTEDTYTAYKDAIAMSISLDERAIRVEILYNMYQFYEAKKDYVLAKLELNAYLKITSQLRDHHGQCLGYKSMCYLLNLMNDYEGALTSARNHLKSAKLVGDTNEIMLAERNVTQFNSYLQDISEAGPSHANAEVQGTQEIIDVLRLTWQNRNDLAIECYSAGKYISAKNMFIKNLEFVDNEYKNQLAKVQTLRNLGVVCETMKNFDMAYNYLSNAYQIAESINHIILKQSIVYQLGLTLFKKNRNFLQLNSVNEKSIAQIGLYESLSRFQEYLNGVTESAKRFEAMNSMGKIYLLFDDDQNAINCFQNNMDNAMNLDDEMKMNLKLGQIFIKNSNNKMAIEHYGRAGYLAGQQDKHTIQMKIYFKLCNVLEKDADFKTAITYYKHNEMVANKHQNHEERLKVHRKLCLVYMNTGEYSDALRYANLYRDIAVELQNQIELDKAHNILERLQSRQQ